MDVPFDLARLKAVGEPPGPLSVQLRFHDAADHRLEASDIFVLLQGVGEAADHRLNNPGLVGNDVAAIVGHHYSNPVSVLVLDHCKLSGGVYKTSRDRQTLQGPQAW